MSQHKTQAVKPHWETVTCNQSSGIGMHVSAPDDRHGSVCTETGPPHQVTSRVSIRPNMVGVLPPHLECTQPHASAQKRGGTSDSLPYRCLRQLGMRHHLGKTMDPIPMAFHLVAKKHYCKRIIADCSGLCAIGSTMGS